ncbi:zinc ABC transporter substrate-binding protein [Thalassococcus sp. BH17M4-6]|uniref:zinc ABC transporter substrate-binding protein n=1 Tax=Thalassococcus sp. BH17M4-6 TaxID=3413148 RepID=UPI003BD41574
MSRHLLSLSAAASLLAGTAMAEVPRVAVDVAPVHALVARVMDGVGEPSLIVQQGASPHEYRLRPSEAQALQDADLVFWVGEGLTPWMEASIETLADDAEVTELLEVDGTVLLEFREGALFEAHAHGDEDHADGDDHDHEDHADGDDHEPEDHADEHGHDHDHGAYDPHAWLSPDNAATWLNVIAAQLSAADPENAGAYFTNAAAARADIATLSSEVSGILDPVRDGRFVVFHDAYQYFETAFDFPASGAISVSDASDPSPARIAEIQGRIADENIQCVLSEPQFNHGLVATVMDGADAKTSVLDPLGSDLEPGPDLYPLLLRNLASSLADCLS